MYTSAKNALVAKKCTNTYYLVEMYENILGDVSEVKLVLDPL